MKLIELMDKINQLNIDKNTPIVIMADGFVDYDVDDLFYDDEKMVVYIEQSQYARY